MEICKCRKCKFGMVKNGKFGNSGLVFVDIEGVFWFYLIFLIIFERLFVFIDYKCK